jgi:hypothetical protein
VPKAVLAFRVVVPHHLEAMKQQIPIFNNYLCEDRKEKETMGPKRMIRMLQPIESNALLCHGTPMN